MLLCHSMFLLLLFIMLKAERVCFDRTWMVSGCGTLSVFIKTDLKGANLTVEVEPATSGMLSMNISNQAFRCDVQDKKLYCPSPFSASVSFHVFKDGVEIPGVEMRSGAMDSTVINGDFYYSLSVQFPRDGQSSITLANGEFIKNLPITDSGNGGWKIAVLSVASVFGVVLVVAVIWICIKKCCTKVPTETSVRSTTPKPVPLQKPQKSAREISGEKSVSKPPPLKNVQKTVEEVAVGEDVAKSPPNTGPKLEAHMLHRVGVDVTDGYHPIPDCYFCFFENITWPLKQAEKLRKAEEAKATSP